MALRGPGVSLRIPDIPTALWSRIKCLGTGNTVDFRALPFLKPAYCITNAASKVPELVTFLCRILYLACGLIDDQFGHQGITRNTSPQQRAIN